MNWIEIAEDESIQTFIKENQEKELQSIALKLSKSNWPADFILSQIKGLQKAKEKYPQLLKYQEIIYPPGVSFEQSSSYLTSNYKAKLQSGKSMIDLTGGFGMDAIAFSQAFESIKIVEPNQQLIEIVKHNFSILGIDNCDFLCTTAEEFLQNHQHKVDLIFIDPSRRNDNDQRVYQLKDCTPDVIELLPQMFNISDTILIKTAPFLDIEKCLVELKHVKEAHVLAVNNECKEVLYALQKNHKEEPTIVTINMNKNSSEELQFLLSEEKTASVDIDGPGSFLYEPNAAILKSGAFKIVSNRYQLKKLSPNTHLYTADKLNETFPGKIFKVIDVGPLNKKYWKFSKADRFMVKTRNFRLKPREILKKLGIKEGGSDYLIATTNEKEEPIVIKAKRVNG